MSVLSQSANTLLNVYLTSFINTGNKVVDSSMVTVATILVLTVVNYHWILKPTDHFIGAWFCSNVNPWIEHGRIFDVTKLFFYQIVGKSGEKLVAEEWSAKKVFEVTETDHFLDVAGRAVPDKKTGRKKKVQPRALVLGDLSDPNLKVSVFLKESQSLTKEDPW